MNSYFASVEQQANPFLRGKPVGVCAYLAPNGCIIASSIEAKKLGITTGCRVKEAKKIHSDVILIENEPAKYRSTTEKIFSILADYTERIEPYSIDEAFMDLTGYCQSLSLAQKIGRQIQTRIKKEVGEWLKSKIGISTTRWLAKFIADIAKPDSVNIITPKKAPKIYSRVKLTDAWGINFRMENRLNRLGIYNLNDLKNYPVQNILTALGKPGYFLWANVNGIELEGVKTQDEIKPKSIGHSYCLPKHTTDTNYHLSVLMKLCEKVGRRLREQKLEAKSMSLYWSYVSSGGFYKIFKVPEKLFITIDIYNLAAKIFLAKKIGQKIRMLAVSVGNFSGLSRQMNLFNDVLSKKNIAQTMDKINDKYGDYTIAYGQMWGTGEYAKDRVGYRKSVKVIYKLQ
ncbi:hypothetical protein C4569_00255 [Candidatus Parcubacteria bacterium]|nr:MAG: hypothetical protein C4569_00255 [Candidatus Parcubacteria bacterium]